jgi:NADPH-dependent 2,4-dienoyl-CoA reductase/sulfur reductase-like enzyme
MSYHAALSHDGYTYTKHDGLVQGLRTYGFIQPQSKIGDADAGKVWDAIVIGAGYTGLIAARDLVKAGELSAT